MSARLGVAIAAYVLAGPVVFVLAPLIGTGSVAAGAFQLVLVLWALGLVLLPSLGTPNRWRVVVGGVTLIAAFLGWAIVVSGGLTAPLGR